MRNRQNLLRNKSLTFWGHLTDPQKVDGYFFSLDFAKAGEMVAPLPAVLLSIL